MNKLSDLEEKHKNFSMKKSLYFMQFAQKMF